MSLPAPVEPGGECEIALRYGGPTAGAREVWPCLWDQVGRAYTLLRPDILWYPVVGEPTRPDLVRAWEAPFPYDLSIVTPSGYTAVAAGSRGDGCFRSPSPRTRLDLAVAPRLDADPLAVYHLPGYEAWGQRPRDRGLPGPLVPLRTGLASPP